MPVGGGAATVAPPPVQFTNRELFAVIMQDHWRRTSGPAAPDAWRVLRNGRARRRRRRPWWWVAPVGGVLVLLWLIAPWLNGWSNQPIEARERAVSALEEARSLDAARWAPDSLNAAEAAFRLTQGAERVEAGLPVFFRDFREIENRYLLAAELARRAAIFTLVQKDDARFSASQVLQRARRVVGNAERVAEEMPFPHKERVQLQRARTLAGEAEILFAAAEFSQAAELAERAEKDAEQACRGVLPLAERFIDGRQVGIWKRWIQDTIDGSRRNGGPAVIIYKEKNLVQLYQNGRPVRTYAADMGRNSLYEKRRAGDSATPEGRYRIVSKKDRGRSRYYKALLLDYPNADDRERFRERQRRGEIPRHAGLGDYIEIHGEGGRGHDWTLGCVALSNADMSDLFSRVDVGHPVTIVGGDGRDGTFSNLARSLLQRSSSE